MTLYMFLNLSETVSFLVNGKIIWTIKVYSFIKLNIYKVPNTFSHLSHTLLFNAYSVPEPVLGVGRYKGEQNTVLDLSPPSLVVEIYK